MILLMRNHADEFAPGCDYNGRLARWLTDIMALQGGFPVPEYGFVGKGAAIRQKRYLDGVKRGYIRDYQPLADFFAGTITRGRV